MSVSPDPSALVEALQQALAAEHAAVAVHEVLGGLAGGEGAAAAAILAGYELHLDRRDHLRSRVAELGEQPVPASAGYRVRAPDRRPATLLRLARRTEERAAEHYATLVSQTTGTDRAWAARQLVAVAEHLVALGARPTAYPGLPELG